jgi:hypothetical protein
MESYEPPINLYAQNLSADLLSFRVHLRAAGSDKLTTVLTGQLLIEKAIRTVVAMQFKTPDHLSKFRFADIVNIGRALAVGEEWYWDAAAALNRLRNAFAHRLQPDDGAATAETAFYEIMDRNNEVVVVNEERLAGEILLLYAQFSKIVHESLHMHWIQNPSAQNITRIEDGIILRRRRPDRKLRDPSCSTTANLARA